MLKRLNEALEHFGQRMPARIDLNADVDGYPFIEATIYGADQIGVAVYRQEDSAPEFLPWSAVVRIRPLQDAPASSGSTGRINYPKSGIA